MNKTELIAVVADKTGMSKKDADIAVNTVLDTIVEKVSEGDKVQLVGFGTFEARTRSAKIGKNPRTGEEISIPSSRIPAFKAGKGFKEIVNQ